MQNLHMLDSFFEVYHTDIKPLIEYDEYLDWLNTLPEYYKKAYMELDFDTAKNDNAFAWHCLENRNWYLADFIGFCEPGYLDEI